MNCGDALVTLRMLVLRGKGSRAGVPASLVGTDMGEGESPCEDGDLGREL